MPLQRIEKEVRVLQAGSNTRLEIPKTFVEMFGIKKGDPFVWVFDPETRSLTCKPGRANNPHEADFCPPSEISKT